MIDKRGGPRAGAGRPKGQEPPTERFTLRARPQDVQALKAVAASTGDKNRAVVRGYASTDRPVLDASVIIALTSEVSDAYPFSCIVLPEVALTAC